MRSKFTLIILLAVLIVTIVGCWDRQEIEESGIVVGIAFDSPKSAGSADKSDPALYDSGKGEQHIIITYQYVVPKAVSGGEKGATPNKLPYINVSGEGKSVTEIVENINSLESRAPEYSHLKVILISSEVARSINIYKLLNALLRHNKAARNVNIFIAEGSAASVFETDPGNEDLPAFKLNMVAENYKKATKMPPIITLGDVSKKMAGRNSFALQRIIDRNDIMDVSGTAVIKGQENKLVGWLDEYETEGFNLMTGKVQSGSIETIDDITGQTVVIMVEKILNRIKPVVSGDNISFTLEIKMEANIAEDWLLTADAFNPEFIKRMEKASEKEVMKKVSEALEKIQKVLKVDIAGFGKKLSIKYPSVWRKVENNWDEQFSRVPVYPEVKINIRAYGRQGSKY